jgi:hypothetical protein
LIRTDHESFLALHTPRLAAACMTCLVGDAAFVGAMLFKPD